MSGDANLTTTADGAASAELCARVLAWGRQGLARVEIVAALGVTLERLEARADADAALAEALALADEAAEAWRLAQARDALLAGRGINLGVWRAAMAWRRGGEAWGGEAWGGEASGDAAPPEEPARPQAIIQLPIKGDERWFDDMSREEKQAYWRERLEDAEADAEQARGWLDELDDEAESCLGPAPDQVRGRWDEQE